MKSLFKVTPLKLSMAIGIALAAVVFLQDQRPWQEWLPYRTELKLLDAKFNWRGPVPMNPQVVIAAGDEKALDAFGLWGSWSRRTYARMLRNLFAAGADVVSFDLVWADELGEADSEQLRRVMLEFRQRDLPGVSKTAQERVTAAQEELKSLEDALNEAQASLSSGKVRGSGKRAAQLAMLALRDAHKSASKELEAAKKAADTLAGDVEGFAGVLTEEAGGISPDQDLEDALNEFSTRIVQGYIAEPNPTADTPPDAERHAEFQRIRSSAEDQIYLDFKSINGMPQAKMARAIKDMCGDQKPCKASAEDVIGRAGLPEEEAINAVKALAEAGVLKMTEDGAEIPDPASLEKITLVGPETTLFEWIPGTPDAREMDFREGVTLVRGNFVSPLQRFADVGQNFGFYSASPDPDGVFRKQPLFFRHWAAAPEMDASKCTACNRRSLTPDKFAELEDPSVCSDVCKESCADCTIRAFYVPSLALSVVRQRFASTPVLIRDTNYAWLQSMQSVALLDSEPVPAAKKPTVIPTDPKGNLLLNYYGPWRDPQTSVPLFPLISVADIVANNFDKDVVKGKAVIFAVTALGTYDQRTTPFDTFVPGVVIHATAVQNMVQGDFLQRPWHLVIAEVLFVLLMGLFLGLVLPRVSVPVSFVLFFVFAAAYWLVDVYFFFARGFWVQILFPYVQLLGTLIAVQAHGYLTVGREKAAMRKAFGACLDPLLVDELATNPDALNKLKGDEREATCMFSDIRGFTTLSENLTPEELTVFLNDYFTPQAAAIMHHKGYLDKYIGDAIMALFGAPSSFPDHATSACYAALDMMDQLKLFKKWVVSDPKWAAFCQRLISKHMDPAAFDIGIGLNTGLMRVGYMGSSQRTNYSALGDAVNLSSRLEGQTKEYGVHVIIGETTRRAAQGNVHARLLDSIRVKGKKEPVRIYECIGRGDPSPEWGAFIKSFETGIELFQTRKFQEAIPFFAQALREKPLTPDEDADLKKKGKPRDLISVEYISRCEMYLENPPPPDWDGVVTKTTK